MPCMFEALGLNLWEEQQKKEMMMIKNKVMMRATGEGEKKVEGEEERGKRRRVLRKDR